MLPEKIAKLERVDVKIHGKIYTIKGRESEEYIKRVANYVDTKMNEVKAATMSTSASETAVLTCVNIADEYFKIKETLKAVEDELKKKAIDLENYKR